MRREPVCVRFVCIPADLEIPKVVTTAVFGGVLVAVNGNYDEVNRLCAELASEYPTWAFRQRSTCAATTPKVEDPGFRGGRATGMDGA